MMLMKTLTCSPMGGPCDEKISGNTPDELMANGMAHLESAHPEMAAQVKTVSKDDPQMVEWNKNFEKDWTNTPDEQ
jgi:predicted small metal-binding protein